MSESAAATTGKMLEQAPLAKMVASMTMALVDAQNGLTMNTIDAFIRLANPDNGVQFPGEEGKRSLLELGLLPSFMHISEATIHAKLTFSCSEVDNLEVGGQIAGGYPGIFSASVNAGYANKYSFSVEGSSELTARIVSVPPPEGFAQRLQKAGKAPDPAPAPAEGGSPK